MDIQTRPQQVCLFKTPARDHHMSARDSKHTTSSHKVNVQSIRAMGCKQFCRKTCPAISILQNLKLQQTNCKQPEPHIYTTWKFDQEEVVVSVCRQFRSQLQS
jgi:hypothetical protein